MRRHVLIACLRLHVRGQDMEMRVYCTGGLISSEVSSHRRTSFPTSSCLSVVHINWAVMAYGPGYRRGSLWTTAGQLKPTCGARRGRGDWSFLSRKYVTTFWRRFQSEYPNFFGTPSYVPPQLCGAPKSTQTSEIAFFHNTRTERGRSTRTW